MSPSDKIVQLMQAAAPVRPRRRRGATVRIEGSGNIVGNGNVVVHPQLLRQLSTDIAQLSELIRSIAAELPAHYRT